MIYLCGPEPVEITWAGDVVTVVWSVAREWWNEAIAIKAKNYGARP